eukprot:539557-Pleurochrysis_carterae.AAC.1
MAPHVSEYAVCRVEQCGCSTAHGAAEQADSVSHVRARLCGAIEERAHEGLATAASTNRGKSSAAGAWDAWTLAGAPSGKNVSTMC